MRRSALSLVLLAVLTAAVPVLAEDDAGKQDTSALLRSVTMDLSGEVITTLHTRPVSYFDSEGEIRPIDLELQVTDAGFANRTNVLQVSFDNRYTVGWEVGLAGHDLRFEPLSMGRRSEDGYMEYLAPLGEAVAVPGEKPCELRYEGTWPAASDRFEVRRGELEHLVVLHSPDALPPGEGALEFTYRMSMPEEVKVEFHPFTVEETDTGGLVSLPWIGLRTDDGDLLGVIPTPTFWDSGSPRRLAGGDLDWEQTGPGEGIVRVRASGEILEEMTYPVQVDPQVRAMVGPLNTITGSAWGHIEDVNGNVLYQVRFNGTIAQIGAMEYDFGPPIGLVVIQDSSATPAWDLTSIPGHVTDAWIQYRVLSDTYDGQERIVFNDHKTNVLDDTIDGVTFGNNIADSRNHEAWMLFTPDYSKDKRYMHTFNESRMFSDYDTLKLLGPALRDIHKSMRGQVDTPSPLPLAPGLFAVAIHDTSGLGDTLSMQILDAQLHLRYHE